jgi:tyrosinase
LNLRKNVQNLTSDELKNLRLAFDKLMKISDNRGFNYIAGFHGVPQFKCWHHWRRRGEQRLLPLFLPWHRAYLYWLEQDLKDQVADVTLPWWDWSSEISRDEGIPKAFSEKKDPSGNPNPLYKSHIFVPTATPPLDEDTFRNEQDTSLLPTKNDVDAVLRNTNFSDFEDDLEEIHDNIHGWVGGSMQRVAVAAFDPIFWAHHCMIDRIWRIWQTDRADLGFPIDFLDEVLEPFPFKVRDVLEVKSLGYDYASTSSEIIVSG